MPDLIRILVTILSYLENNYVKSNVQLKHLNKQVSFTGYLSGSDSSGNIPIETHSQLITDKSIESQNETQKFTIIKKANVKNCQLFNTRKPRKMYTKQSKIGKIDEYFKSKS